MRTTRVLVVEDDRAVADAIGDMVRSGGFECECVHTDVDAYNALPRQPDLAAIVVDVNLGRGTTGYDVARAGRRIKSDLVVIYVSGQVSPHSFATYGVPSSVFVQKPFSADDILAPLRERLGEAEA